MNKMYEQFGTDTDVERNGVILDYGDFRVTVARSGGSNKKYQKTLERISRPYQRAIQSELIDNDKAMDLLKIAVSESVVRNWEVKNEDGEWAQGIEGKDGDILPFSKENVLDVFRALDDLFQDVREQSSKAALFRSNLEQELGED